MTLSRNHVIFTSLEMEEVEAAAKTVLEVASW